MSHWDDPSELETRPAQLRHDSGGPRLKVICEGDVTVHSLGDTLEVTLGRSRNATIQINHPSVSRIHVRITRGDQLWLEDMESANGTRVGGRVVHPGQRVELLPNEVIDVGDAMIVLESDATGEHPARAAIDGTVSAGTPSMVVADPNMERIHKLLARVAPSELTVLLLGETGVGKDVLARQVHELSPRADKPMLSLNCAALAETLLESELFGHEAGAFTGAAKKKVGLLESAAGGTVFLDEVGELSASTQVKLLRALENREILPVGATTPRAIEVRFVAATNRNLEDEVRAGGFRQDLYFRLNGISITIPPLRERISEIAPLARLFVGERKLSAPAVAALESRPWRGNIRELRNVLERAAVLADDVIEPSHLRSGPTEIVRESSRPELKSQLADVEREKIFAALEANGGNQTRAAEALGISRSTLVRRLREYRKT